MQPLTLQRLLVFQARNAGALLDEFPRWSMGTINTE
jgi:hypothetical protein